MPLPWSGTLTTSARPPATADAVTGFLIMPLAEADRCSAVTAPVSSRLPRLVPVTTTWAGVGAAGNAAWILFAVCTTVRLLANPPSGGLPSRMPSAGAASASIAMPATAPQAAGRRTTRRTSAVHSRDGSERRRPRNGTRPRSAHGPSQDSKAGRNVSEPTTVTPTTAMVPMPIPVKTG